MQLGLGVLGFEDAAERGRVGAVRRAQRGRAARGRGAARATWPAPAQREGFLRRAGRAGMLERDDDGRYSNTPTTDLFLDPAKPSYMGGLLEMLNARLYQFWGSLTEALRTGEPQSEVKTGGDFFATLYADPEQLAQFAERDERPQRRARARRSRPNSRGATTAA